MNVVNKHYICYNKSCIKILQKDYSFIKKTKQVEIKGKISYNKEESR